MILYREAKKLLSKYVGSGGKCPNDEEVDLFIKQVLQYMLIRGNHGSTRKFCFHAENGCFALPYEVETPLKVKVDGAVGSVWNKWFEYQSGNDLDDCYPAGTHLYEEPQTLPTAYQLPEGGAQVGVMGTCTEGPNAHVIIKGLDNSGRTIYVAHDGGQTVGERLNIKKHVIVQTQAVFSKITEVYKEKTNGYVELFWVRNNGEEKGFLSSYDPYEQSPSYRFVRIKGIPCPQKSKVSLLARIRLKQHYADEDVIPFDNYQTLVLAAQTINSQFTKDIQSAQATDTWLKDVIKDEAEYKKVNVGQTIEMFHPLSPGGAIRPIIGSAAFKHRRRY